MKRFVIGGSSNSEGSIGKNADAHELDWLIEL